MSRGVLRASLAVGFLAVLLLPGCASQLAPLYDEIVPTRIAPPVYEVLFPHYVQLCAVSQYRPRDGLPGGIPGHAVMYLKGACIDAESAFPLLRRCETRSHDWRSPGHGVGISVNRWFRNVNWVAVPGIPLFFFGNLERFERLTREHFDATVREAIELGIFEGVELKEYPNLGEERSLEDFVRHHSLGTDFALRFGRSVFCATLPIEEPMLDDMIEYLNGLNREYATGNADYNWSGYADNCVHTLRNTLAAAGVWEPKSVNLVKLRHLFNVAVPANEFVNLGWLATRHPLGDFDRIYRDEVQRQSLLDRAWLPMRHGALVESAGVHQSNDLYDTRFRIFVLEGPFGSRATRRAESLLNDARSTELDTNLRFFRERYRRILEERPEDGRRLRPRGRDYREARSRYYAYVEAQLADVERLLEQLEAIERERGPLY